MILSSVRLISRLAPRMGVARKVSTSPVLQGGSSLSSEGHTALQMLRNDFSVVGILVVMASIGGYTIYSVSI